MQNEMGKTPNASRRSRKARRRAAKKAAQERVRAAATAAAEAPPSALLADPATIAGAIDTDRPGFEEVRAESPVAATARIESRVGSQVEAESEVEAEASAQARIGYGTEGTVEAEAPPAETETAPDRSDLDRLRTALRFQSDELETLRARWRPHDGHAPEVTAPLPAATEPAESTATARPGPKSTPSPLMDARSARRLAADARARERASREALEEAKRAIGHAPETTAIETKSAPPPAEPAFELAGYESTAAPSPAEIDDAPAEGLHASAAQSSESRAAPAPPHLEPGPSSPAPTDEVSSDGSELTELRSLLAFARETSSHQRETLRSLRARLAQLERPEQSEQPEQSEPGDAESTVDVPVERSDHPPVSVAAASDADGSPRDPKDVAARKTGPPTQALPPGPSAADFDRLRERMDKAEAEAERHRNEKAFLEEALEERVQQLTARREEIEALRDRFEAQDRALDAARREYELERTRHGRTLDTLAELQATLARALPIERIADDQNTRPRSAPRASQTAAGLTTVVAAPSPLRREPLADDSPEPRAAAGRWATVALETADPAVTHDSIPATRSQDPCRGSGSRAYAHWLDERVRSRFGPLGAERFVDLFRDAARTTNRRGDDERTLMVLAQDAASVASRIAESLLLSGTSRFTIHYAEAPNPDREHAFAADPAELPMAFDSPLRGSLECLEPVATADALGSALDAIRPDAIVCHDFLSHTGDVGPWLDRLVAETHAGATLVLAERIGLAPSPTAPPVAEVAERIWSKLPERYTRTPSRRDRLGDWREAFAATTDRPENALLDALRARTPLALIDRFGYLALSYVDSPIASNFDMDSDRDRRFLAQLADLDERRIESGEAPALAFVARVDPAEAR